MVYAGMLFKICCASGFINSWCRRKSKTPQSFRALQDPDIAGMGPCSATISVHSIAATSALSTAEILAAAAFFGVSSSFELLSCSLQHEDTQVISACSSHFTVNSIIPPSVIELRSILTEGDELFPCLTCSDSSLQPCLTLNVFSVFRTMG